MTDLICNSINHEDCDIECEHEIPHKEFFDCTDGECGSVSTAICVPFDPKATKERRIKELQDELDQLKQELLEFAETG